MLENLRKMFHRSAADARTAVAAIRREYTGVPLTEDRVSAEPVVQFESWFNEAIRLSAFDPSCMFLATASESDSTVSGRIVLLKGFDERGFVFFTNYESRKGMQLAGNPRASLTFYWPEMVRQVCIEGVTEKTSPEESDSYFNSRPAGSRISAIASPQSRTVSNRQELENLASEIRSSGDLTRPSGWGGYRLKPDRIEFWQGRPNRLHDRILYNRADDGSWKISRLAP
jgi:pyridoxamine 5'-phosphate oxidase